MFNFLLQAIAINSNVQSQDKRKWITCNLILQFNFASDIFLTLQALLRFMFNDSRMLIYVITIVVKVGHITQSDLNSK